MANNNSTQQQTTSSKTPIKQVPRPQPVYVQDSVDPSYLRRGIILNENKK